MSALILSEVIENKIYVIRGMKVMLDSDLAILYGVQTHVLNQAVKRNKNRFPVDFMFPLNQQESKFLISQFVISKKENRGGRRTLPYVFTEQGVAMLSSVLNSNRAEKSPDWFLIKINYGRARNMPSTAVKAALKNGP